MKKVLYEYIFLLQWTPTLKCGWGGTVLILFLKAYSAVLVEMWLINRDECSSVFCLKVTLTSNKASWVKNENEECACGAAGAQRSRLEGGWMEIRRMLGCGPDRLGTLQLSRAPGCWPGAHSESRASLKERALQGKAAWGRIVRLIVWLDVWWQ